MDPLLYVSVLLVVSVLVLLLVVRAFLDKVGKLKARVRELESAKQSQSTTYGRITEQWAPFMAGYPHDPKGFRFLGSPVDGVQFNEDGVVFVEIKSNRGELTPEQRRIRDHVEAGRVRWLEFRVEGDAPAASPVPASQDKPPW